MEAMQSEYGSVMKNNTCDLVDRPQKCKVIDTKWVYKAKYKSDGSLDKYKAWLAAKGFAQIKGFDYQDTFAPKARLTTIHTVLALAAQEVADGRQIRLSGWKSQGGCVCGTTTRGLVW